MNLCLGTVQFGIDYGLHGRQKPSRDQSVEMLNYAVAHGIDAIDTSALYGEAEVVVGEFLSRGNASRERLFLVSKFGTSGLEGLSCSACTEATLKFAHESLQRIGTSYLDAYICHVPTAVYDDRILSALKALRESGLARHVGFSAYEVEEAKTAIQSGVVDFLQLPFSILDQRMATSGILDMACSSGVVVHSRSAFVQGLALMNANDVPPHLLGIVPYLNRLDDLCQSAGVARRELSLAFVRSYSQISHLVFGVHELKQLQEVIASFSSEVSPDIFEKARQGFAIIETTLVMPNKWSKLK